MLEISLKDCDFVKEGIKHEKNNLFNQIYIF